jgi:hypothetical protein
MVYLGACLIAGIRLAREKQVNVRVIPTSQAVNESVDLAYEIFNRVFRNAPERIKEKWPPRVPVRQGGVCMQVEDGISRRR